jgi:hypothetical protein
MIVAVMGITLGLLFIVINPTAGFNPVIGIQPIKLEELQQKDYETLIKGLPKYDDQDTIDRELEKMFNDDIVRFVDITNEGVIKIIQVFRQDDENNRLELGLEWDDSKSTYEYWVHFDRGEIYKEWEGNKPNIEIMRQVEKWPLLNTICFQERNKQ